MSRAVLAAALAMLVSFCLAGPALAAKPHFVYVHPHSQGPASDTRLTVKTEIGSTPPVTYHLDYGTDQNFVSFTSTPEKSPAPAPDGEPGHYIDLQTINGLAPNTKYYVRAVATNADGSTKSTEPCSMEGVCAPPQQFTTIGPLVIRTGTHGAFTFDGERDLLKFPGSGMVNGGGRSGHGAIQVSLHPDFRPSNNCDPGPSDAGNVNFNERTDHHYTHRCTLSVPPALQTQEVTVYMRAYFAGVEHGDPCTREGPSDPIRCVGQTVTFKVPGSTFTDSAPSPAQVRSALGTALSPKGAAAKIGSILKKGFSAAKLNAPSAGRAAIVWKKSGSAGASAAGNVVVARGSKTVTKAGKVQVKVRLTKRGKKLLRQAKRKKTALRVRATGSFTPKGGKKVTRTKSFKLRN